MSECLEIAQDSLCIQSVNLRNSYVSVRNEIDLSILERHETKEQSFRAVSNVRGDHIVDPDKSEFYVYRFIYSVGIRLIFSNEEEQSDSKDYEPVAEIVCDFEAKYLSQKQLSEEELKAFSKSNVGYHVWPFWREYVQSTCARIGLSPAFEVPLYIIRNKKAQKKTIPK